MDKPIMTTEECAAFLGMSKSTVLRRARAVYEHEDNPLVKALNEADELVLQE